MITLTSDRFRVQNPYNGLFIEKIHKTCNFVKSNDVQYPIKTKIQIDFSFLKEQWPKMYSFQNKIPSVQKLQGFWNPYAHLLQSFWGPYIHLLQGPLPLDSQKSSGSTLVFKTLVTHTAELTSRPHLVLQSLCPGMSGLEANISNYEVFPDSLRGFWE